MSLVKFSPSFSSLSWMLVVMLVGLILSALSCIQAAAIVGFKQQNGLDAQRLDGQKASNAVGGPCSPDGAVLCVGNLIGRCLNGLISPETTACAGGLACQVLPLVNKPGTSVSCDTEADKLDRIASALGNVVLARRANNAGEFVCIDDTKFKHFTSATDFVVESCPPGLCATRTPPIKNPCIGRANAERIDGVAPPTPQDAPSTTTQPSVISPAASTAAPDAAAASSTSLSDIRIANAQEAVQGNVDKANVKVGDACTPEGVVKCIGVTAVMCTNGVITGPQTVCPASQECSVLPNVNKPGTVQRCNPTADTASRIALGLRGLD